MPTPRDALRNLVPFKPVACRVLQLLAQNNPEIKEITELIESDPALSSEVLIVANSPLIGTRADVKTVNHAVTMMGLERTKSITATAAMRAFVRNGPRSPVMRSCWLHSVACALISSEIAHLFGVTRDQAYIAGLLHDIGRVGLLTAYPDKYSATALGDYLTVPEILEAERKRLGMDHCAAGELLTTGWNFPAVLATAAAGHHGAKEQENATLAVVRCGCLLADTLRFEVIRYQQVPEFEEIRQGLPGGSHPPFAFRPEDLEEKVIHSVYSLDGM